MSVDSSIRCQRGLSALLLAIVLAVLLLPGNRLTRTSAQTDAPPPSGNVIVVLKDDAAPASFSAASTDIAGVEPEQVYTEVFPGFSATVTQAEANALADDPRVEAIYPDGVYYEASQTLPSGVDRIDDDVNPSADIDGNDDLRVNADIAILDTGVAANTGDLNLAGGADCANGSGFSDDGTGHGTHVAGIAAAIDNDVGVIGVAPGARIWSVRVLDHNGNGTDSTLICGLDWVAKRSSTIDVVNMSIQGAGPDGACDSSALHLAICAVVNDADVPVVVAAGNSGSDTNNTIPATYDQVIAVSNVSDLDGQPGGLGSVGPDCFTTQSDDQLSTTSNYGPDVDIAAPGTCILSLAPGGGLVYKSGTSMSSPHVAGAVALYRAANPRATPNDVRGWLLANAKPQDSPEGFTGDPDSHHEPLLWLGGGSAVPTGTATQIPTDHYRLIRSAASPQSAAST